jgi:hypothetical protein
MVAVIVGVGVRVGSGVNVEEGRETTVDEGMKGRVGVIEKLLELHPARKDARITTRWFKDMVLRVKFISALA